MFIDLLVSLNLYAHVGISFDLCQSARIVVHLLHVYVIKMQFQFSNGSSASRDVITDSCGVKNIQLTGKI